MLLNLPEFIYIPIAVILWPFFYRAWWKAFNKYEPEAVVLNRIFSIILASLSALFWGITVPLLGLWLILRPLFRFLER